MSAVTVGRMSGILAAIGFTMILRRRGKRQLRRGASPHRITLVGSDRDWLSERSQVCALMNAIPDSPAPGAEVITLSHEPEGWPRV